MHAHNDCQLTGRQCCQGMTRRCQDLSSVNVGLCQVCALPPLLFSIYTNGLVDELKKSSCGVECGGNIIPGLLFADDTSLFASDGQGSRRV